MKMSKDDLKVIHRAINDIWNAVRDVCLDKELNIDLVNAVDKELCEKVLNFDDKTCKEYYLRYYMASAILTYLTHTNEGHH